jgi:hypothetical protein
MKLIQSPNNTHFTGKSLFLAGGISGCSNWQSQVIESLSDTNLVLVNPRREDYISSDLLMEREQITWEHKMLSRSHAILFWFPPETLCPITLFELGTVVEVVDKKIFIGCDLNYKRLRDINIQLSLRRPGQNIHYNLPSLIEEVRNWDKSSSIF